MCGRFVMISDLSVIEEAFDVREFSGDVKPSFNIAPGREIASVIHDTTNRLIPLKWGLVPPWAKDLAIGNRLINARAETVAEKPSFRAAFKKRRCLILANGYYEWKKQGTVKIPHYICLKSERPFGFAGLYESWTSNDSETLATCTIITTEPNELLRPLHDRMPAIVPKDREARWLDPAVTEEEDLLPILKPYADEEMEFREVSTLVNSPFNDIPECIGPPSPGLI
ncbi:MAG: SOS response-associated peptidase [Syntrophobacterales bacterium]|nr:MAG: SOS response-associated peptidase [Syntrophobacterales bacterium]